MNAYNSGNAVSYYLNGVGRELGTVSLTNRTTTYIITSDVLGKTLTPTELIDLDNASEFEISGFFDAYNIISGDYAVDGLEILESLRFANESGVWSVEFDGNTVGGLYDTNQPTGERGQWIVSSTGDYESPPSPNPISGDQFVFFNGQKLISGVDYVVTDAPYYDLSLEGVFFPTGFVTGLTGTYFTMPPIPDATRVTGNYTSFYNNAFWPNSNAMFLNGVRQNVNVYYIEHSTTKDLISGRKTAASDLVSVYNNVVYVDPSVDGS